MNKYMFFLFVKKKKYLQTKICLIFDFFIAPTHCLTTFCKNKLLQNSNNSNPNKLILDYLGSAA